MTTHSETQRAPEGGHLRAWCGGPWHHREGLASRKGSCYQGSSCQGCGLDGPAPGLRRGPVLLCLLLSSPFACPLAGAPVLSHTVSQTLPPPQPGTSHIFL